MGGQKPKCHSKCHNEASVKYPGVHFEDVIPLNRRTEIPSTLATNLKRRNIVQCKSNQNPMICRACIQYSQNDFLEPTAPKRPHLENTTEDFLPFHNTEDGSMNLETSNCMLNIY